MSVGSVLAVVITVLASVGVVAIVILLGWILLWKVFLSKFHLVRELLENGNRDDTNRNSKKDTHPIPQEAKLHTH